MKSQRSFCAPLGQTFLEKFQSKIMNTKEKALIETFGEKRGRKLWKKIVPHYTPKHASWLNQAEIEISMFSRGCLGKQRVGNIGALILKAAAWKKRMNRKKVKIDWAFSRRKARVKFKYKTGKN